MLDYNSFKESIGAKDLDWKHSDTKQKYFGEFITQEGEKVSMVSNEFMGSLPFLATPEQKENPVIHEGVEYIDFVSTPKYIWPVTIADEVTGVATVVNVVSQKKGAEIVGSC